MATCVCGHNPQSHMTVRGINGVCQEAGCACGGYATDVASSLRRETDKLAQLVEALKRALRDDGTESDECRCVLPEQSCPVCSRAAAEMPF